MTAFPRTEKAIQEGIDRNLHTCVQVYVSVAGTVELYTGFGKATAELPADADTIMAWRSAGKPLTAAAICQAWERGQLSLDSQLGEWLPEASSVVRQITIRSLLTHQSGLPMIETGWPEADWDEILQRIMAIDRLEPQAAYQPQSSWFLLGEVLQRLDAAGRSFSQIVRDEVLQPLGMSRTFCGLADHTKTDDLPLADYFTRERGELVDSGFASGRWLSNPSPGGNFRGPVSDLGKFYEMLLNGGVTPEGHRLLSPTTIAAMTTAHRRSKFDETLQHVIDMGLGLLIDSNLHGADQVPYGFSRYCSERTFGHGGSQCAMGFCDPERKLVVAWSANAFCGEGQHQRRNRAINEAIFEDLGWADGSS